MEISATRVYEFIRDLDFPISRQELIDHAEEHDVSPSVIERLEQLPDRMYESYAEVIREVLMP